jgi:hypothetical protein
MGKPKRIKQIINILKTSQKTDSIKGMARQCKVSKNTVRDDLRMASAYDEDLAIVDLPPEQLRQVLFPSKVRPMVGRRTVFDTKIDG